MKFSVFQVSRKGGRQNNEDRMGYCYTQASGLFMLADGMGGHPEGEVAAQMSLQIAAEMYQKEAKPVLSDVATFLSTALTAAHHALICYASDKGMLDTPRTTIVAVVVQGNSATWVHCGDSRLYLVRNGELLARTQDHSFIEQHKAGTIAMAYANRNILFTCLGSPTKPVFDVVGPVQLRQGDKILLCSDGLWDSLREEEVVAALTTQSVSQAVPHLVEEALRNAGARSDNVSAIALEWETPDAFELTRTISTEDIPDGEFASTFQDSALGLLEEDLDDVSIERSIAEINEVIRRSAAKKL
ncbi:MAG: PP2C family serine/threonine-protein phosphatase [Betaproteobacteria bacterium]